MGDISLKKILYQIKRNKWLGSIFVPVFLLLLLEIILQLSGYGVDMSLFKEYDSEGHFLMMNSDVSKKYFTNDEDATTGFIEIFRQEKKPETFRVFVLGASTGIGFPYTANGSFSRWLKYRLMKEFPDKEIEIINLSLTAVNSYAALDFTKQIINFEPDAVLVYLGHNEYYGALGVGSTSKLGNNVKVVRFLTELREFKTIQLINNINRSTNRDEKDYDSNQNLMMEMASDTEIPFGSDEYQRGLEQFQTNMDDICQILSRENVPTIISTLISNEKSLKPFISDTTNNELSADYFYELATENYKTGNFETAKEYFLKAKDLDLLRYRAPEEMNKIIHELTIEYPGVFLADTKSLYEARSEHGILGNEMIMDHVHPYLSGQGLIAESFYQELKENNIISVPEKNELTFSDLLKEMPLTAVDSLKGIFLMNIFLKEWPFNLKNLPEYDKQSSFEARLANQIVYDNNVWFSAMDELSSYYQQNENWDKALKVAEASVLEFPYEESSYAEAYRMSLRQNNLKNAEFHLHKAFQLNPQVEKARDLFSLNMDIDNTDAALLYLGFLIENDPQNVNAYSEMIRNVEIIVSLKNAIEVEPDNIESINTLAEILLRLRYKNVAIKYAQFATNIDPGNSKSLELLQQAEELPDYYN